MSERNFSGSCLCGSVAYEISAEPMRFYHCHCRRCRKATGTGHATNIIIKPVSVEWTRGQELLRSYKVPDAERFSTNFCGNCGSLMPRIAPDMSIGVVPAGTLDTDHGLVPEARIFAGSRAPWSCAAGGLPEFDTYPGK